MRLLGYKMEPKIAYLVVGEIVNSDIVHPIAAITFAESSEAAIKDMIAHTQEHFPQARFEATQAYAPKFKDVYLDITTGHLRVIEEDAAEYVVTGRVLYITDYDDWCELAAASIDMGTPVPTTAVVSTLPHLAETLSGYGLVTLNIDPQLLNECWLADSNACLIRPVQECYGCGQYVCENCALYINWYTYGKQWVCHYCIEDHDRTTLLVEEHLLRLAGY